MCHLIHNCADYCHFVHLGTSCLLVSLSTVVKHIILTLLNIQRSIACGRAEYRTGDECCPMCSPGNRVYKHCTEFTSTSCVPCTDSTFLDEPNGLTACIPCTNCDPGFGLKVKQSCRPSSDTVCGTLEGFYCLDPTKDGCRAAQRHSSCKPGQYINHTGINTRIQIKYTRMQLYIGSSMVLAMLGLWVQFPWGNSMEN
uniref:TNFR-Cys domain-containing protein n=1 Tax=Salmo trutta TaxID=8032 RepID=A0A673ZBD7_SALTR